MPSIAYRGNMRTLAARPANAAGPTAWNSMTNAAITRSGPIHTRFSCGTAPNTVRASTLIRFTTLPTSWRPAGDSRIAFRNTAPPSPPCGSTGGVSFQSIPTCVRGLAGVESHLDAHATPLEVHVLQADCPCLDERRHHHDTGVDDSLLQRDGVLILQPGHQDVQHDGLGWQRPRATHQPQTPTVSAEHPGDTA